MRKAIFCIAVIIFSAICFNNSSSNLSNNITSFNDIKEFKRPILPIKYYSQFEEDIFYHKNLLLK